MAPTPQSGSAAPPGAALSAVKASTAVQPVPEPTQGGSYTRDPVTQQLVRTAFTRAPGELPPPTEPQE